MIMIREQVSVPPQEQKQDLLLLGQFQYILHGTVGRHSTVYRMNWTNRLIFKKLFIICIFLNDTVDTKDIKQSE